MPGARYELPGLPPEKAAVGLSAFMPGLTSPAASSAQSYKYAVAGYPGTRGIPAPPPAISRLEATAMAQQGTATSFDAPPVWYPNQYYQQYAAEYPGAGQQVKIYDPVNPGPTSLLPVPAEDPSVTYRAGQYVSTRPAGIVNRVKAIPWLPRLGGGGNG